MKFLMRLPCCKRKIFCLQGEKNRKQVKRDYSSLTNHSIPSSFSNSFIYRSGLMPTMALCT